MNTRQLGWAVAALVLSAPAFAQTAVQSFTGAAVTSGTGVVVTPGAPSATVVAPAGTVAVLPAATISGAVLVPAGTTETVSANSKTIVTRYWVNVPAGVERDPEFQRWMRLR
ncbi:MAG TPA: hypothetical protein VF522_22195 [Ramlibacter sp.]|uniref:hypothetical protein n=1 Tax=Ramlibacter sp. TaxID=1917967 RepID=UPI002ED53D23